MGHVYILDHIKRRMIARPRSFPEGRGMLKQELEGLYKDGRIYGALFQGSSTNASYSSGSDIDVAVAINGHSFFQTKDYLDEIADSIFQKLHIPIEFKPRVNTDYSKKGVNRLPRNFMQHLEFYAQNRDNIVGENPLNVISPKPARYAYGEDQDTVMKMGEQLSDMWEDPASCDPNDQIFCDYLEKIIRRPVWTAFDMLVCMTPLPNQMLSGWNPTFRLPTINGNIPPKEIIVNIYKDRYTFINAGEHIDAIMDIRRRYRNFLLGIWDMETPEDSYKDLLMEIKRHEIHTSEFIAKNMQFLLE